VAEERNPVVPPPASPLAPDLPVTTPLVGSELDDDAVRATAAGPVSAPLPGSLATPENRIPGTLPGDSRSAVAASSTAAATADSDDPEAIREQIERTREDMSATLNELQERLSPQHLAQQAKDSVREATVGRVQQLVGVAGERAGVVAARAQDVAGTAVEQAREHPIPVALAGAGAGLVWWLMRRSANRQWNQDDMYDWDDADMSYERDYASLDVRRDDDWRGQTWASENASGWTRILRDNPVPASIAAASIGYMLWNRRSADWSDDGVVTRSAYAYGDDTLDDTSSRSTSASLAEGARDVSRQAREKASAIGEQVTDSVRSAQARASEVSRDVSRRIRTARTQTSSQFERWMRDNPLAVGVAAIAAGAVVGLTVPRTRTEDEMLGASRDALVERAADSAQHIKEQVREKVQTVASDLTDSLQSESTSSTSSVTGV
jgi:ElaB/YqjD/DUF883 family membrane-anchored ribosome-binding protein